MLRVYILSTVPLVEMEDDFFFFFSFSSYYEISTIIILITFHLSEKTNERDTQAGDIKTDLVIIWIIRIFARDVSLLSG